MPLTYFIGPKAANLPDFRANVNIVLDELLETRQRYFPNDAVRHPEVFCICRQSSKTIIRITLRRKSENRSPSNKSETTSALQFNK
jgi:hypothetical protein